MEENRLGGIGGMYVCTYLKENVFITKLVNKLLTIDMLLTAGVILNGPLVMI